MENNLTPPPPITPENPLGVNQPSPPFNSSSPTRQSKIFSFILSGLIMLIFSANIFNSILKNTTSQTISPTPTGTVTWNTYTVPRFNFSVGYPPEADCGTWGDDFSPNGYLTCKKDKTDIFTIHLVQEYIPEVYGNFRNQKPIDQQTIAGKTWNHYSFYHQDKQIEALNYYVTAFETINNNQLIIIEFHSQELTAEQKHILSTFKFTNQEINVSNWKTYSDPLEYISFKYPDGYFVEKEGTDFSITAPPVDCQTNVSGNVTDYIGFEAQVSINYHTGKNFADIWQNVFGFEFDPEKSVDGSTTIDGKKAYYFHQGAEMILSRTAYLVELSPTTAAEINFWSPELLFNCEKPLDKNKGLEIMKSILSTIKFTN